MNGALHQLIRRPGPLAAMEGPLHPMHQQCARILRCTANALAASPGGFRFRPGTRPWLDGVHGAPGGVPMAASSPYPTGVTAGPGSDTSATRAARPEYPSTSTLTSTPSAPPVPLPGLFYSAQALAR